MIVHGYRPTPNALVLSRSGPVGERFMKDTVHPPVHRSVHPAARTSVPTTSPCRPSDTQFGRGQNTELGWNDPGFYARPRPKFCGVVPARCLPADVFAVWPGDCHAKGPSHHVRHRRRHHGLCASVRITRRCRPNCTQFGHVQNTVLGWSDPHFSGARAAKGLGGRSSPTRLRSQKTE